MSLTKESFIKNYWQYFLELEGQLLETKRFAEFDPKNKVYSLEYLQLFQAVCSEIDVIGKELACLADSSFVVNHETNIKRWGYAIQQRYSDLKDTLVVFYGEIIQQPFKRWEYAENITIDINGNERHNLKLVYDKAIQWWKDYNSVKHQRVGLIAGTRYYQLANQKNLILAFSALFIMESKMMEELSCLELVCQSKLFSLKVRDE